MAEHWIVCQGDHGYVPNSVSVFETEKSALDCAQDVISNIMDSEIDNGMDADDIDSAIESIMDDLRTSGIADFNLSEYDLSYISIKPCDCDQPCDHNESGDCEFCPHCQRESFESTLYWQWCINAEYMDRLIAETCVASDLNRLDIIRALHDLKLETSDILSDIESQVVGTDSPLAKKINAFYHSN